MSDSLRPHGLYPTRFLRPWNFPGKSAGVGCRCLLQCVKVKSLSPVRLLATPWTAAHQAPPPMGFSRQECWSGVPFLAHPKGASRVFVLIVTPGPFQVSSEGEGKSRSVSKPVLRSACRVEGALLLSSPRQIFTSQPRVPGGPFHRTCTFCCPFPSALTRPSWTSVVSSPFNFSLCC